MDILEKLTSLTGILLQGFGTTFAIFSITLIFSIPLGMVIAFGRMSKHKSVRIPVSAYISIMRGTPLMLQIIFIYFAPKIIFHLQYDRFLAVCIAFVINYAAYFAEIFRGGIQSMEKGQYEAASTLGFTRLQTFFKIILPQVIKRVLPATGNEVITLVKDTSLAQVVGVMEMFSLASKHTSTMTSVLPLVIAGVVYYIFNFVVAWIFGRIEKHLGYYR